MKSSRIYSGYYGDISYKKVFLFSIIFHVAVLILLPIAFQIMFKPKKFIRPKVFQLVKAPVISSKKVKESKPVSGKSVKQPEKKVTPKVKKKSVPKKKTIAKKKAYKSPVKENVNSEPEENLDELDELLSGVAKPVSDIAIGKPFKYQWYLNNVRSKVERFWRPPFNNDKIHVVLAFSINRNGTVPVVKIVKSSGNSTIDNLALRAVKRASPFGKLPIGYVESKLDIEYTLWLSGK